MAERKKRRLPPPRGANFLIAWSRGAWAEEKVVQAVNATPDLLAVPFGASRGDPMTYEQMKEFWATYQERQGLYGKRPDLLIFQTERLSDGEKAALPELIEMDDLTARPLVEKSLVALEVETSVWRVKKVRALGKDLSFTVKDEDLEPLKEWVAAFRKPLYVTQVFHDTAWMVAFDRILARIADGSVKAVVNYTTKKATYSVPLSQGLELGDLQEPTITAKVLEEDSGRVTPYIDYAGGSLALSPAAVAEWLSLQ